MQQRPQWPHNDLFPWILPVPRLLYIHKWQQEEDSCEGPETNIQVNSLTDTPAVQVALVGVGETIHPTHRLIHPRTHAVGIAGLTFPVVYESQAAVEQEGKC